MKTITVQTVFSDGVTINYVLKRKNVGNINLRIKPDGTINVSAHPFIPQAHINAFVNSKETFIQTALEKFRKRKQEESQPRNYTDGEIYTILGKEIRLNVLQEKKERVTHDENCVYLAVKDPKNYSRKQKLMDKWFQEQTKILFTQTAETVCRKFDKHKIQMPVIRVRNMKSRWGSCHTQKRIITVNTKLAEMEHSTLEYVLIHEFCHFLHPNHSKDFYACLTGIQPDWKEHEKKLKNCSII